jgi:CRISPR-associated exonuclease Cas4
VKRISGSTGSSFITARRGMKPDPELRVSDLKQYYYCPRVVYYHYVMPVDKKITYKMEKGKAAQEVIEALEARRKMKSYGLQQGSRVFNPWVRSDRLGLSGKLDLLIETEEELYPVDFKFTRGRPFKNHRYQLGGYALILDDTREKAVTKGFIYLIPQKDAVVFDLSGKIKEACLRTLEAVRRMIRDETYPDQPARRAKCVDCEYQNYCRDIW